VEDHLEFPVASLLAMTNADARHLDNLEAQFLADDVDVAAAVVVVVVEEEEEAVSVANSIREQCLVLQMKK
jgi:hypothetical protein